MQVIFEAPKGSPNSKMGHVEWNNQYIFTDLNVNRQHDTHGWKRKSGAHCTHM